MRALVLLVLVSGTAFAQTQSISLNSEYRSVQGVLNPTALLNGAGNSLKEVRSILGYKIGDVVKGFNLSGAFVHTLPDYSGFLLVTRSGEQVPLSRTFTLKNEFSGSATLDWASGNHSASLGWSGSLSQSPFYSQSLAAKYSYSFYNQTTTFGVQMGWISQDQPATYYISPDFQSKLRPSTLHSLLVGGQWDQVLTERWKSSLQLTSLSRQEDRPQNVGVAIKQGYALLDQLFSQVAVSTVRELRSQSLKDDRGYYSMSAIQGDLTYEPWIDFLITASYALVIENEFNPNSSNEVQVGSDQYGLALNYRNRGWGFDLRGAYHITNTQLVSLAVSGGLTWQI